MIQNKKICIVPLFCHILVYKLWIRKILQTIRRKGLKSVA